jgi:hypothetical protein
MIWLKYHKEKARDKLKDPSATILIRNGAKA